MLFIFKKLVSRFLFPVPLCLELLGLGLVLLLLSRWQRTGKVLVAAGFLLLLVFSSPGLSDLLLAPLERTYPPVLVESTPRAVQPFRAAHPGLKNPLIAVLGRWFSPDPGLPDSSRVDGEFLGRIVEGIRVHRLLPGSSLAVSLPGPAGKEQKRAYLGRLTRILGLEPGSVQMIAGARDTRDEARLVKGIAEGRRVVLVSTASHMPRAVEIFRRQGMRPIPAPCGQQVQEIPDEAGKREVFNPAHFFPSAKELHKTERAVYEYLGLAWVWLKSL